jgi:hypothetical protein
MSLEIPHRYEPQIQQIAEAQHISSHEALDRVLQAGLEKLTPPAPPSEKGKERSYASFFGSIKGTPGAHGSKEAVDLYISELRNEW